MNTKLATDVRNACARAVEKRRKHETDSVLVKAPLGVFRRSRRVYAKSFEHIGATSTGGYRV